MGLTPSKPDPYVLRIDDKRATMHATVKPTRTTTPSSTSSTSLTKTGSSAVLPINSNSSSVAPSSSAGENYTYGKPAAGNGLNSQTRAMSSKHLATNGPVIRQHSQTNSNIGVPAGIAASEKATPGMSKKQLSQRHQPPSSSSGAGEPSASLKHAASSMKLTTTGRNFLALSVFRDCLIVSHRLSINFNESLRISMNLALALRTKRTYLFLFCLGCFFPLFSAVIGVVGFEFLSSCLSSWYLYRLC